MNSLVSWYNVRHLREFTEALYPIISVVLPLVSKESSLRFVHAETGNETFARNSSMGRSRTVSYFSHVAFQVSMMKGIELRLLILL